MLIGRYLAPFVGQEGVTHLLALARAVRPTDLEDLDLTQVRAHTLIVRGERTVGWMASLGNSLERSPIVALCLFRKSHGSSRGGAGELASVVTAFISPHVGRASPISIPR